MTDRHESRRLNKAAFPRPLLILQQKGKLTATHVRGICCFPGTCWVILGPCNRLPFYLCMSSLRHNLKVTFKIRSFGSGHILCLYKKCDSASFHTVECRQSFPDVLKENCGFNHFCHFFKIEKLFFPLELINIYHGFSNLYPEGLIFQLSPMEQVVWVQISVQITRRCATSTSF